LTLRPSRGELDATAGDQPRGDVDDVSPVLLDQAGGPRGSNRQRSVKPMVGGESSFSVMGD
jgi:hypothetical protein